MPVYQLEAEMPAQEINEWFMHFRLSQQEAKLQQDSRR